MSLCVGDRKGEVRNVPVTDANVEGCEESSCAPASYCRKSWPLRFALNEPIIQDDSEPRLHR